MTSELPAPRLLVLVAHPDDAEFSAGGLCIAYRKLGYAVKIVTLTNGDAGHHEQAGPPLAARRRQEAEAACRLIGAEGDVWNNPDGWLEPTVALRQQVIREIRQFKPDLVVTHRANDYHPDHRAVAELVRDASYMVTVPAVLRDVPALHRDPVVCAMVDLFTKPVPHAADVVLHIESLIDPIVELLACHRSQVYEWLPYHDGVQAEVPLGEAGKKRWLKDWYQHRIERRAHHFRSALVRAWGEDLGQRARYIEAYEVSEYAAPLDAAARRRLFPFA